MYRLLFPLLSFCVGLSVCTQLFAEKVGYAANFLGTPLITVGHTSYYWFYKFIPWWLTYHPYVPQAFSIWPLLMACIVSFLFLWITKPVPQLTSHGSARWALYKDLLKMDLISGSGVTVGLYDSSFTKSMTSFLRWLDLRKNEKTSYLEMAFDKRRDTKIDEAKEMRNVLENKLSVPGLSPKQKKRLQANIKRCNAFIEKAPEKKFDVKQESKYIYYGYVWPQKTFSKLYAKLNHFYLRDNSNKHMAVIAPTRSGKGVGLIIPTLLGSWKSSVIVNDIKSENWGVTAGYRKYKMGHTTIKFEPTASDGSSARWNPLDEIRIGTPSEVSQAQNLAAIIADYEGKGKPDHWTANAATVIMCVILFLKYAHAKEPDKYPNNPSLYTVASFMKATLERGQDGIKAKGFVDALKELADYEHVPEEGIDIKEWNKDKNCYETRHFDQSDLRNMYTEASSLDQFPGNHPIIFQTMIEITAKPDNELGSIISTANTALKEYLDPVLAENTSVSDFDIDDIMNYRKPVSLYLVTPPSDLLRLAPIFRLFFEMMVRHHARSIGTYINGQAKSEYKHKCLFLMDEFSSLGNLQSFAATLSYIAGYGMKVFLINQGLPQINGIYGKDNQILMNCHLQIFYAPNDNDTAKYAESLLGNKTILVKSKSRNNSGGWFNNGSTSEQATARALMTADELKRLGDQEIIVASGSPPVLTDKIKYYENNYFLDRLMNAPVVSDIVRHIPDNADIPIIPNPRRMETLAKAKADKKFVYDDASVKVQLHK